MPQAVNRNEFKIIFRAENICLRYPEYRFNISGMGNVPENVDQTLGTCSQMVCFVLKEMVEVLNDEEPQATVSLQQPLSEIKFPIEKFRYELLFRKVFPFDEDTRNSDEKALDDVKYFINRHRYEDDPFFNDEKNIYEFPIENILQFVDNFDDVNALRAIIQKEFTIDINDCIVCPVLESSGSEQDDVDDDADIEQPSQDAVVMDEEVWD